MKLNCTVIINSKFQRFLSIIIIIIRYLICGRPINSPSRVAPYCSLHPLNLVLPLLLQFIRVFFFLSKAVFPLSDGCTLLEVTFWVGRVPAVFLSFYFCLSLALGLKVRRNEYSQINHKTKTPRS